MHLQLRPCRNIIWLIFRPMHMVYTVSQVHCNSIYDSTQSKESIHVSHAALLVDAKVAKGNEFEYSTFKYFKQAKKRTEGEEEKWRQHDFKIEHSVTDKFSGGSGTSQDASDTLKNIYRSRIHQHAECVWSHNRVLRNNRGTFWRA